MLPYFYLFILYLKLFMCLLLFCCILLIVTFFLTFSFIILGLGLIYRRRFSLRLLCFGFFWHVERNVGWILSINNYRLLEI
jgi:hypothetical protein